MSGRKQFNMASWLKPPNPTIRQGLIQCQWCDLKFQSAQGYAIHKKVHIENRDPLRKRLKFGKVKLRTPSQPPPRQWGKPNQWESHTGSDWSFWGFGKWRMWWRMCPGSGGYWREWNCTIRWWFCTYCGPSAQLDAKVNCWSSWLLSWVVWRTCKQDENCTVGKNKIQEAEVWKKETQSMVTNRG